MEMPSCSIILLQAKMFCSRLQVVPTQCEGFKSQLIQLMSSLPRSEKSPSHAPFYMSGAKTILHQSKPLNGSLKNHASRCFGQNVNGIAKGIIASNSVITTSCKTNGHVLRTCCYSSHSFNVPETFTSNILNTRSCAYDKCRYFGVTVLNSVVKRSYATKAKDLSKTVKTPSTNPLRKLKKKLLQTKAQASKIATAM